MANQEQVSILMQGVDVWNSWREDYPVEVVDLREARFTCADLSNANLNFATLEEADLRKANLQRANNLIQYLL